MKVTIKDFNVDWKAIKNECRQTVNMGDSTKEPNDEWKKKLLICRHSPLRIGTVLFHFEDIPYYVMGHLVRHVHAVPFVGTSREDRTGVPREERRQTDLVNFDMYMNIEELMNISERRICMCADKETIKVWRAALMAVKELDENIYWSNVPQCVAHGGCIEPFSNCNFYDKLMIGSSIDEQQDVFKRYDIYNKYVDRMVELGKEYTKRK